MPSFVMLLELNGVDMFLEATVRGFTETYNNKSSSYCRITFDTKFCRKSKYCVIRKFNHLHRKNRPPLFYDARNSKRNYHRDQCI